MKAAFEPEYEVLKAGDNFPDWLVTPMIWPDLFLTMWGITYCKCL